MSFPNLISSGDGLRREAYPVRLPSGAGRHQKRIALLESVHTLVTLGDEKKAARAVRLAVLKGVFRVEERLPAQMKAEERRSVAIFIRATQVALKGQEGILPKIPLPIPKIT